jgi:hypothetical protein
MKFLLFNGLVLLGLALFMTTKNNQLPRGIRNHNPANIRASNDKWQGMTGQDNNGFIIFESAFFGLRAMAKLLQNYKKLYGLQTVAGIIDRWAPDSENNTLAYIDFVSNKLNVAPNEILILDEKLPELMQWIVHYENGLQPYIQVQFIEAIKAA